MEVVGVYMIYMVGGMCVFINSIEVAGLRRKKGSDKVHIFICHASQY